MGGRNSYGSSENDKQRNLMIGGAIVVIIILVYIWKHHHSSFGNTTQATATPKPKLNVIFAGYNTQKMVAQEVDYTNSTKYDILLTHNEVQASVFTLQPVGQNNALAGGYISTIIKGITNYLCNNNGKLDVTTDKKYKADVFKFNFITGPAPGALYYNILIEGTTHKPTLYITYNDQGGWYLASTPDSSKSTIRMTVLVN